MLERSWGLVAAAGLVLAACGSARGPVELLPPGNRLLEAVAAGEGRGAILAPARPPRRPPAEGGGRGWTPRATRAGGRSSSSRRTASRRRASRRGPGGRRPRSASPTGGAPPPPPPPPAPPPPAPPRPP